MYQSLTPAVATERIADWRSAAAADARAHTAPATEHRPTHGSRHVRWWHRRSARLATP
jgi:hypothetical protein